MELIDESVNGTSRGWQGMRGVEDDPARSAPLIP